MASPSREPIRNLFRIVAICRATVCGEVPRACAILAFEQSPAASRATANSDGLSDSRDAREKRTTTKRDVSSIQRMRSAVGKARGDECPDASNSALRVDEAHKFLPALLLRMTTPPRASIDPGGRPTA